jgi:hypothetical protein
MNLNAGVKEKDQVVRMQTKENKRFGRASIIDPVPKRD